MADRLGGFAWILAHFVRAHGDDAAVASLDDRAVHHEDTSSGAPARPLARQYFNL
jgi:hypothetical protein